MNRLFYYMDGDYKRTPKPRNRNPKNIMNNRELLYIIITILIYFITFIYVARWIIWLHTPYDELPLLPQSYKPPFVRLS